MSRLITLTIPATQAARYVTEVRRDYEGRITDVAYSIYPPREQVLGADVLELNAWGPGLNFQELEEGAES